MNLASLSIKRPIFITSALSLLIVLGLTSIRKLGVDQFPDVSLPILFVQAVYPGATPNDVETLVSKPIEEELGSLPGLKRLYSSNLESVGIITAEFNFGIDIKDVENQVRARLQNIRRNLPSEMEEPVIRRLDPADQPIVRIAVKSNLPAGKLFDVADDIVKPPFERIDGVGLVEIIGGRKREIQVLVDRDKLQERELTMLQVANRLGATAANVPVGKVDRGGVETVFRTLGEFTNIESLKKVSVNFLGSDRGVALSEIASIEDTLEKEKFRATINGEPALFVDIFKQRGTNTVKIAKEIVKKIDEVQAILKDRGIQAEVVLVRNGSQIINANVADVRESIVIGIALCILVVFFFLGSVRSTVITGLALPNSLLGAFILMYAMGFTINIMTLLALSLAVGLLIDDAIVVRENIFRHMEMGKSPKEAAEFGTQEVTLAVLATTAVILAVFGPVGFIDGIVGQFFKPFALTVCFAMIISTFDAFTVAPMLSAYWATAKDHSKVEKGFLARLVGRFDRFQSWLEELYETTIRWTLRFPKTVLAGAIGIFVVSLGLTAFIPKTFLPPPEDGQFEVRMELPPGTSLEKTAEFVGRVDSVIRKSPAVQTTAAVMGNRDGESNRASIYTSLKPWSERRALGKGFSTREMKDFFRKELVSFKSEGIVNVGDYDAFGGGQRPIDLAISGDNLEVIVAYVEKILPEFKKVPGFVDVDTNYRKGKPEYQIIFDRNRAEALGVSSVNAGAELRARVEGVKPAVLRDYSTGSSREYDIRVKFPDSQKDLRADFQTMKVPNVNYNLIPLRLVAEGKEVQGFSQIDRMNKSRFVHITGDIGKGGALGGIVDGAKKIMDQDFPKPPGVTYKFLGQAESFAELAEGMAIAIGLGVIFIYLVLASLYESFITPITILTALPLAVCGAFVALLLWRESLNIYSMIGIILLLGVAAKNSILLVDYILILIRDEGMTRSEAIVKGCRTRLRPILMTSFALIAGTIPIALGLNEASAQRVSMGIAIIGGLVSSTFLTLLVVPAFFGYVDDLRMWLGRFFSRQSH
jgi:HAE1 family hydrophobic/amphiphilic exporter-1